MSHIQVSSIIPAPKSQVFDLLTSPQQLAALLKDHVEVEVVNAHTPLQKGAEFKMVMTRFGLSQPVRLKIEDLVKGHRFVYRQSEGLFSRWLHTERFEDHGDRQTLVTDIVDYSMPFGLFGHLADDLWVRDDMTQILTARLDRARRHFTSAAPSVSESAPSS